MKRWPLIRHIRYCYLLYRVNQHYAGWMKLGLLPTNAHHDFAILDDIWAGKE
jgi:hypothetical protein